MKKIWILLIFSLFSLTYCGLVAQSKKSDQLKKDKQKIQTEINKKQKLLDETRKNKKASQQQLSVLRDQIATRELYMTELQNEIDLLADERRQNENEASRLTRKLTYLREDYSRVVYNTFKNRRQNDPLLFILSAEEYNDMFKRIHFYVEYSKDVKQKVDEITATREGIAKKCEELTLIENEKQGVMREQEATNAKQQQQRREAEKLSKELKKKESNLVAEIKKKQQEKSRLDAAIKKAIDEEIAAAAAKQKANSNKSGGKSGTTTSSSGKSGGKSSSPTIVLTPAEQQLSNSFASNKGKLPWPVSACAKTLDYGTYQHPDAPSVTLYNNGIELLTHANADVKAVFKGTVSTIRSFEGSYFIIIRHGEYLTTYQNITGVTVKVGQEVNTGQKIGTVAKKSATGTYELSFFITKGTTYLNPNSWLQRLK